MSQCSIDDYANAASRCGSRARAASRTDERDVAQNLLVSLSSSFQTAPTFWVNPKNGVSYTLAVQSPQYKVDSLQALMNTPSAAPIPIHHSLANLAIATPHRSRGGEPLQRSPDGGCLRSVDGRDLAAGPTTLGRS